MTTAGEAARRACAIVLAAGAGRRAGGPKATVVVGGQRLVDRAVLTARAGGCADVLAVVRGGVDVPDAVTVVNSDPDRGLASSLALGLAAATVTDAELAVVLLVDQPGITAAAVARLRMAPGPAGFVWFATYHGRRAHPVRIDRALWREVAHAASGDDGAKAFAHNNPLRVRDVDCSGLSDPRDLDTAGELSEWRDTRSANRSGE